jgi:hypothetical protein
LHLRLRITRMLGRNCALAQLDAPHIVSGGDTSAGGKRHRIKLGKLRQHDDTSAGGKRHRQHRAGECARFAFLPQREGIPAATLLVAPPPKLGRSNTPGCPVLSTYLIHRSCAPHQAAVPVADEDVDEPSRELPYRAWRNERRRDQRAAHNSLVSKIHSLVPPNARFHTTQRQGAGVRGLGAGGRSLHQALEDVVGYLRNLRAAAPMWPPALEPRPKPAISHREALLSSRSLFVLEVESNVRWTIRTLGRGAADFFAHAPWGGTEGQSIANLVRCEDVPSLVQMWNPHTPAHAVSAGGGGAVACRLHIITFPPSARTKYAGWELQGASGLADDGEDFDDDLTGALPEAPWQYTPVFVHQLIPVLPSSRSTRSAISPSNDSESSNVHRAPRALLIASLGAPCAVSSMPECTMCGRLCCFRTEMATPLEMTVPVRAPRRLVDGIQRLTGSSDKVWDQKIQREFAWMGHAFHRIWHCGMNREDIALMITTCPPELVMVLCKICGALNVLIQFKMQEINKAIQLQSQLSESQVELDFPSDDEDYSHFNVNEVGILKTFYAPQTQERRSFVLSPGFKIMADCSFDELCMRMTTCELDSPFNETEWMCYILDQMLSAISGDGVTSIVRYHRMRGYQCGKLVRWESSLQMDAMGRITSAMHVVTPVRVSEFDQQMRENPALVRPFQLLLGDQRGGQALINSALSDVEAYRFRNLQRTQEGRSFLSAMAALFDRTMASVYAKAEQVSAMQAAMAAAKVFMYLCVRERGWVERKRERTSE